MLKYEDSLLSGQADKGKCPKYRARKKAAWTSLLQEGSLPSPEFQDCNACYWRINRYFNTSKEITSELGSLILEKGLSVRALLKFVSSDLNKSQFQKLVNAFPSIIVPQLTTNVELLETYEAVDGLNVQSASLKAESESSSVIMRDLDKKPEELELARLGYGRFFFHKIQAGTLSSRFSPLPSQQCISSFAFRNPFSLQEQRERGLEIAIPTKSA